MGAAHVDYSACAASHASRQQHGGAAGHQGWRVCGEHPVERLPCRHLRLRFLLATVASARAGLLVTVWRGARGGE